MIDHTDQICIEANQAYQCGIWSGKLLSKAMTDGLQILQTLQHVQLQRRYLIQTHTHTHTPTHIHTTPITSLPRQRAVGAGQRRQSIDWALRRRRRKEAESAAGHERQRRWRPIGNQCTMSVSAPYGQDTWSDSYHSPFAAGPHHTRRRRMLTVQCPHCQQNITFMDWGN